MTTGFRVPIRKPGEANTAAGPLRDQQEQIGQAFGRLLTVTSGQTLPTTGIRLFKVDDPRTDLLDLRAGADNVIPHGLKRVVKEAFVSQIGSTAVLFSWSLKDPALLATPLDPLSVVCLRVTANVTARVRVL